MFESDDEEDTAELKEQIKAAYKTADIIDELKLSETSSSSDSGSSDSDNDNADSNKTKQYFQHQETTGTEETGSSRPLLLTLLLHWQILAIPGVPARMLSPKRILRKPQAPKGRVPTTRNLGRVRLLSRNFRPLPKEYGNVHKQCCFWEPH